MTMLEFLVNDALIVMLLQVDVQVIWPPSGISTKLSVRPSARQVSVTFCFLCSGPWMARIT